MRNAKKYGVLTDETFPDGVVVEMGGEQDGYVMCTHPNFAFSWYRLEYVQPLPQDYHYDRKAEERRMMKSEFARRVNALKKVEEMEKDVRRLREILVDTNTGMEEVDQLAMALGKLHQLFQ